MMWLSERRGRYCLVSITGPSSLIVAALRGKLGDRDEDYRQKNADFFRVHDGHADLGIGQPGFLVPHELESTALVDDHGAWFACDEGITTRVILSTQDTGRS